MDCPSSAIAISARYAKSGTDLGCATSRLTQRTARACCGKCGTDAGSRSGYAMPGTDVAHGELGTTGEIEKRIMTGVGSRGS
eukprot:644356-Rhodomonas_salina.2